MSLLEELQYSINSPLGIAVITLLGLLVGSFLNVVIYRLPIMIDRAEKEYAHAVVSGADPFTLEDEAEEKFNLWYPPSACPRCGHKIRAWENIPVISYLLQRGKCTGCQISISPRYALVEVLTAFLSFLVALAFHDPLSILFALIFTWCLITLVFIDAEHQILPDSITLPLLWLGILAGFFEIFVPLKVAVMGAMIGYLSLWSVYWIFKLITGREGMGYGDFKLLAALCAFQGVHMLPIILLIAPITALIYGGLLRVGLGKYFAFGPFLASAGWLTFMYGGEIASVLGFIKVY